MPAALIDVGVAPAVRLPSLLRRQFAVLRPPAPHVGVVAGSAAALRNAVVRGAASGARRLPHAPKIGLALFIRKHYLLPVTAHQLRSALAELGWKQARLARYLSVSESAVSRWLSGDCRISGPVAMLVATATSDSGPPDPKIGGPRKKRGRREGIAA